MPRPRRPSYRTCQLIYARLLKGPLWLDDWRTTGLKSRSTVHSALKYFYSKGMVTRRRKGYKILYKITPLQNENGVLTWEKILWDDHLYKMSREEKRSIERMRKRLVQEFRKIEDNYKLYHKISSFLHGIFEGIIKLSQNKEYKEVYEALGKLGIDWRKIPIHKFLMYLLKPHLAGQLCIDCLRKGYVIYLVTDHYTGEVICPREGIVKEERMFEIRRSSKERPSPFPPKSDEI